MTDLRPHLRLLAAPAAAACPTPDCGLPARGPYGLCEPCERVYRCLLVLCDRLLDRDIARLEHDTPGLVVAARVAITTILHDPAPPPVAPPALAADAWTALLPTAEDIASVSSLLSELEQAAAATTEGIG